MTFPAKISDKMPPDDEMVMGTVVDGDPLTVDVRGQLINPGRLSTTGITVGDSVALLRQDATYLTLGKMISGSSGGLSLTSIQMFSASANVSLTAALQAVPGTLGTITTSSPTATVLFLWTAEFEVIAANTALGVCRINVDGSSIALPSANFRADTTGGRASVNQQSLRNLAPGSHEVFLDVFRLGGADGTIRIDSGHTNLLVVVFE